MSLIELQSVSKVYQLGESEVRAVDNVDLSVEDGEFIAIVGPSGSGKSTLMHLIGCLDTPTEGTITIDGFTIRSGAHRSGAELAGIRNQKIGFVFQFFNLMPRLNILQNVELPMIYAGISASEREVRAKTALETVGLSARMKHRPAQLSGGQAQRAAIARALVNNPKIILADEPTGNLDTQTGETILGLFCKLNEQGCTIAIVTHEVGIAHTAHRLIEIRDGRIVKGGGSREQTT